MAAAYGAFLRLNLCQKSNIKGLLVNGHISEKNPKRISTPDKIQYTNRILLINRHVLKIKQKSKHQSQIKSKTSNTF